MPIEAPIIRTRDLSAAPYAALQALDRLPTLGSETAIKILCRWAEPPLPVRNRRRGSAARLVSPAGQPACQSLRIATRPAEVTEEAPVNAAGVAHPAGIMRFTARGVEGTPL